MSTAGVKKVTIEDARIIFRNFSGKPTMYNAAGKRNFCVIIPSDELAKEMEDDGWNIRYLKGKYEDDEPVPYIQVSLRFDKKPPKIVMITSKKKTILQEEDVKILDWAEIKTADLVVQSYNWIIKDKNGDRTGVKAYLKSLYVVIDEDELDLKYDEEDLSGDDPLPF